MAIIAVDVKKLRQDLKMTQYEFSARFGFELSTLRHWEQGQRSPTGPARTLLLVISRRPEAVTEALDAVRTPTAPEKLFSSSP